MANKEEGLDAEESMASRDTASPSKLVSSDNTVLSKLEKVEELNAEENRDSTDAASSSNQPYHHIMLSSDTATSRSVCVDSTQPQLPAISLHSEGSSNATATSSFSHSESGIQSLGFASASSMYENSTNNESMETIQSSLPTPSNPLTEFILFPNLPTELRLKIWNHYSVHDSKRIVEVTYERTIGKLISLSLPPALLSVNYEAREEAKRLFSRFPRQVPNDPPIYLDLNEDICFIREDTGGVLSDQNLLLSAIFGNGDNVTVANLPAMKHLMLDVWVMGRACWDLSPLKKLRQLDSFRIVMKESSPQATLVSQPQSRVFSYSRTSLRQMTRVRLQLHDILGAIRLFWGGMDYGLALSIRQALTDAQAELYSLQEMDNFWETPEFELMTFGHY